MEKAGENYYFKGSYTWSHYYGTFDQDGSTGGNDANIFIGSSFISDGVGRQMWDFKNGNLRSGCIGTVLLDHAEHYALDFGRVA